MKYERSIIRIEGSQYIALPPGVFKDVKKVIMDVVFLRNDSSLTIRVIPVRGKENGTPEKEVVVKVPVEVSTRRR